MTRAAVDDTPLDELESLIANLTQHETDPATWWKGPLWFEGSAAPGDTWEIG